MLFNEEEFKEFLHGQIPSVNYEVESAHNQIVDWRVPTTYGDPQTYHLVFSNKSSARAKTVHATVLLRYKSWLPDAVVRLKDQFWGWIGLALVY